MTFRNDAKFDTTRVRTRSGGGSRGGAIAIGGGGLLTVILGLVAMFFGIDLTGIAPALQSDPTSYTNQGAGTDTEVTGCTGADANDPANYSCRMEGAADSIDSYWAAVFAANSLDYSSPYVTLYSGSVDTACGSATSAVGPFYCPGDQEIYIDTTFFDEMRTRFGAESGNLSQMYVLAHEWGHHVQQLTGQLQNVQQGDTGPQSSAVRSELQADCYAGAWIAAAPEVPDGDGGAPVIESVSRAQVEDALNAAMVIGDDHLQEMSGGVNPEGWTHGSSEQRQTWLLNGYNGGVGACDTWSAPTV